jgi:hypothetical protein
VSSPGTQLALELDALWLAAVRPLPARTARLRDLWAAAVNEHLAADLERAIVLAVQADPSRVVAGSVAGFMAAGGRRTGDKALWITWLERTNEGTVVTAGAWSTVTRIGRVIDTTWRKNASD